MKARRSLGSISQPIKVKLGEISTTVKDSFEEADRDHDLTYRGYVAGSLRAILGVVVTFAALFAFCAALGLVTGGSFLILFAVGWCLKLIPTRERYAREVGIKRRVAEFNDNFHLDMDVVQCPVCMTRLSVVGSRCPKCKYEIGKKIEEARAAAIARGEVEPPPPPPQEPAEIEKPPVSLGVFFIIAGVIFFGALIWFKVVRPAL